MPEDGAKPVNVAVLADAGSRVELVVPVERLVRIAEHLTSRQGVVTGSVKLAREQGRIVAEVELAATLALCCQRCMQPLQLPIQCRSRVVLLENEAAAADVPPELETALAPEGRLPLAELVEEELLLALPAAPRHDGVCPGGEQGEAETASQPTQRPFANLGELLGRSKH